MEIVTVHAAVSDTHRLADARAQRHLERGRSPGDRQAGAGHEGELHSPRRVVHLLGVVPVPGEVLVVEHGHGAVARPEHLDDLLEELVARIARLALFVARVLAVLADQHHAVNGELAAAAGQGLRDGRIDFHGGESGRAVAAQVVAADLVYIEGNQIHGGPGDACCSSHTLRGTDRRCAEHAST